MGAGLAAPHAAPVAGPGGADCARRARRAYDPTCYLCPGNARAGGAHNPAYDSTFVFDNDFAALHAGHAAAFELRRAAACWSRASERGICRVICFSPRHDLTLARMAPPALRTVVDTWAEQYRELGALPGIGYVQIFENRGAMMGASNPHPHGQIWATEQLPNEAAKEAGRAGRLPRAHGALPAVRLPGAGARRRARASWRRTSTSWRWCRSGRSGRSRRC